MKTKLLHYLPVTGLILCSANAQFSEFGFPEMDAPPTAINDGFFASDGNTAFFNTEIDDNFSFYRATMDAENGGWILMEYPELADVFVSPSADGNTLLIENFDGFDTTYDIFGFDEDGNLSDPTPINPPDGFAFLDFGLLSPDGDTAVINVEDQESGESQIAKFDSEGEATLVDKTPFNDDAGGELLDNTAFSIGSDGTIYGQFAQFTENFNDLTDFGYLMSTNGAAQPIDVTIPTELTDQLALGIQAFLEDNGIPATLSEVKAEIANVIDEGLVELALDPDNPEVITTFFFEVPDVEIQEINGSTLLVNADIAIIAQGGIADGGTLFEAESNALIDLRNGTITPLLPAGDVLAITGFNDLADEEGVLPDTIEDVFFGFEDFEGGILVNNGASVITTINYTDNGQFVSEEVVVHLKGEPRIQSVEDFILDQFPDAPELEDGEEPAEDAPLNKEDIAEYDFEAIYDVSGDGTQILLVGTNPDGQLDAFIIDVDAGVFGGFVDDRILALIENSAIRDSLIAGEASQELLQALNAASPEQIREFGRGIASIAPVAISNVMSNAMNHTFNLNSRFDALHRENFAGANLGRKDGFAVYAFTTAVLRDYESNVSNVEGDVTSIGAMVVVDYKLNDRSFVGVGAGYKGDESDLNNNAELDADTFSMSLYGSFEPVDNFFVDTLFQYASVDMESERNTVGGRAIGEPEADAYGGQLRASYYFHMDQLVIAPKAALDIYQFDFDSYSERGGAGAANVQSFDITSIRSTLGVQAQYLMEIGGQPFIPHASIDWTHEYDANSQTINAAAGGANLSTRTDRPERDTGLFGLGASYYATDDLQIFGQYSKNFGNDVNDDHVLRLGLSYVF